ncbi:MAG TPA: hypothetical protein VIH16_03580 [Bellilinea sp.]
MKECPKHPNALAMEAWNYCPLCGAALIESIAGMPVITSPAVDGALIVSTETLNSGIDQALKIAEEAIVDAFRIPYRVDDFSDSNPNNI